MFYTFFYSLANSNGLVMTSLFQSSGPVTGQHFFYINPNAIFNWGTDDYYLNCNCIMQYVRMYLDYAASAEDQMKNLATMDDARKYILIIISSVLYWL